MLRGKFSKKICSLFFSQLCKRPFFLSPPLKHHDHSHEEETGYDHLLHRLEKNTVSSPYHPSLEKLLQILVNEEEASFLSQIPLGSISVSALSKRTEVGEDTLNELIDDFARRGLIFDFYCTDNKRYVHFPDVVIGWFEFICMRDRDNELPMEELESLFTEYCKESGMQSYVYGDSEVQLMRTFVREDVLSESQKVQILDYESVTKTLENATLIAIQNCTCKHMFFKSDDMRENSKLYQEKLEFEDYLETCLTMDYAAEGLIRNGISREISKEDALEVVHRCMEAGMVQTADNSQRPAFLCNCDKDTCKFLGGFSVGGIQEPFMTSNFIATFDVEKCSRCATCVTRCPMKCFEYDKPSKTIQFDGEYCLGCGVCCATCDGIEESESGGNGKAIVMQRREKDVLVPEDMLDRLVRTAYNRDSLHNLLFTDPNRVSHRVLRKIMQVMEQNSLVKSVKAIGPLKSIFLKTALTIGGLAIQMPENSRLEKK